MSDVKQNAARLMADALGIPVQDIGGDIQLGVTPQWDSLAHMRLILGIESHIGQTLQAHDILNISGLEDVENCLTIQS